MQCRTENNMMRWLSKTGLIVFGITAGGLLLCPDSGQAQTQTEAPADSISQQIEKDLEDKDTKIFLDKIEILGRIEKPQTVFILPGRDPTVDDIQINRSFFKEIFRRIEKDNLTVRAEQFHKKSK